MLKLIKKLNNFRFTAIIAFVISVAACLYAAGAFVCYHFTGEVIDNVRVVGFTQTLEGRYVGMALFFLVAFEIGFAVFVVYNLVPFILNKEKLVPRKNILLIGAISTIFQIGIIVIITILAIKENPLSEAAIYATLPIGILAMIGSGLFLFPYLKCNFYQPAVVRK